MAQGGVGSSEGGGRLAGPGRRWGCSGWGTPREARGRPARWVPPRPVPKRPLARPSSPGDPGTVSPASGGRELGRGADPKGRARGRLWEEDRANATVLSSSLFLMPTPCKAGQQRAELVEWGWGGSPVQQGLRPPERLGRRPRGLLQSHRQRGAEGAGRGCNESRVWCQASWGDASSSLTS